MPLVIYLQTPVHHDSPGARLSMLTVKSLKCPCELKIRFKSDDILLMLFRRRRCAQLCVPCAAAAYESDTG